MKNIWLDSEYATFYGNNENGNIACFGVIECCIVTITGASGTLALHVKIDNSRHGILNEIKKHFKKDEKVTINIFGGTQLKCSGYVDDENPNEKKIVYQDDLKDMYEIDQKDIDKYKLNEIIDLTDNLPELPPIEGIGSGDTEIDYLFNASDIEPIIRERWKNTYFSKEMDIPFEKNAAFYNRIRAKEVISDFFGQNADINIDAINSEEEMTFDLKVLNGKPVLEKTKHIDNEKYMDQCKKYIIEDEDLPDTESDIMPHIREMKLDYDRDDNSADSIEYDHEYNSDQEYVKAKKIDYSENNSFPGKFNSKPLIRRNRPDTPTNSTQSQKRKHSSEDDMEGGSFLTKLEEQNKNPDIQKKIRINN